MSTFKRSRLAGDGQTQDIRELGKPILVKSNHFELQTSSCKIYQYLVKIHVIEQPTKQEADRYMRKLKKRHQSKFEILNQLVESNCSSPSDLFYNETPHGRIVHAFDGNESMYTWRRLPIEATFKQNLSYLLDQKELKLELTIRFTAELDLSKFEQHFNGDYNENLSDLIRAVEIILKHGPVSSGLPTERGIFPRLLDEEEQLDANSDRRIDSDGLGKKAVFGHIQTVKLMGRQLNLVVDRAAHAFYIAEQLDKTIMNILIKSADSSPWTVAQTLYSMFAGGAAQRSKHTHLLNSELKSLQIETTHLKYRRKFRIFELTREPISDLSFEDMQTKTPTKVLEYYGKRHGRSNLCPTLPAINVGKKNSPIYLPIEVCRIALNQKVGRLRGDEASKLIKCSAHQPIESRFGIIEEKVRLIQQQGEQKLSGLIHLDVKPIEVEGVQLFNPKLNYANLKNYQPSYGKWKMQGKQVLEAGQLAADELCLVNLTEKLTQTTIDVFMGKFLEKARELGVSIEQPRNLNKEKRENSFFCEERSKLREVIEQLLDAYGSKRPKLVLFFINKNRGDKIYKWIKYEAEINFGLHTQCLTEQTLHTILAYYGRPRSTFGCESVPLKDNGDYILSSLLLKVNAKLGGVNCAMAAEHNRISNLGDNLLVIGADVTHPSIEDCVNHSICSVVASLDANYFKYVSVVKFQEKSKEEIIRQMSEIMRELLELYVRHRLEQARSTNCPINESDPAAIYRLLPQHVLFYRDGISDGQYAQFREFEVKNMHQAFAEFSQAKGFPQVYKPAVNTVIVMKRHTTRFQKLSDDNDDLNEYERQQNLLKAAAISVSCIRLEQADYQQLNVEQRYQIDEDSETGRTYNINPGTLVNHEKLVRSDHEFYLCSHNCDKGTIRSTHYHILQNESQFELAELQKFTYNLCYLFGKGTKSISIPTPVKYAHQAAYRARNHLSADDDEKGSRTSGNKTNQRHLQGAAPRQKQSTSQPPSSTPSTSRGQPPCPPKHPPPPTSQQFPSSAPSIRQLLLPPLGPPPSTSQLLLPPLGPPPSTSQPPCPPRHPPPSTSQLLFPPLGPPPSTSQPPCPPRHPPPSTSLLPSSQFRPIFFPPIIFSHPQIDPFQGGSTANPSGYLPGLPDASIPPPPIPPAQQFPVQQSFGQSQTLGQLPAFEQPQTFGQLATFEQPPAFVPPTPSTGPTTSRPNQSKNQKKKKGGKKEAAKEIVVDEKLKNRIKVRDELKLKIYFL